jgi:hypothetical protein
MKDSDHLIKSFLRDTFGYHRRLKRFIKAPVYLQTLFHKKGYLNKAIIELDVNRLYATPMTTIKIPKEKPMMIINTGKVGIGYHFIEPEKIGSYDYCITQQQKLLLDDYYTEPRKPRKIIDQIQKRCFTINILSLLKLRMNH